MKRESIIPYNVVIKAACPGPWQNVQITNIISPNNVPNIPKAGAAPPMHEERQQQLLKKFSNIVPNDECRH